MQAESRNRLSAFDYSFKTARVHLFFISFILYHVIAEKSIFFNKTHNICQTVDYEKVSLRKPLTSVPDCGIIFCGIKSERGKKMINYDSAEYKRSRAAYMAQCAFEYFISILVADAFLAKLLSSIGINDSLIGIISSFISMAFIFQLISIFLMMRKINVKKMIITCDTVSIMFFMLLYLVPFIPVGVGIKTAIVTVGVLAAYFMKYLIYSMCYKWANSYVEPQKRARYSATKEIISLLSGIVFTAAAGYAIDKYESLGNLNGGFLFLAAAILILNICNFVSLMMIGGKSETAEEEPVALADVMKNTVGNRSFRNVIIMTVMWNVAQYFTIGFLGIFKTKDLMISVFAVQVINMIANFARMAVSRPFGKYSDKKSYAKGFNLAMMMAAAAFFINIFTTNATWYLIIAYTVLYNCSLAGSNQNSFNITYSYVKSEYITQAMAIKNSIGGVCGFLASVLGGKILAVVQANNNMIFGIHIYGQQLLSAVSCVITLAVVVFIHKVIEKQKVTIR